MSIIQETVEVNCPADQVFAYVSDAKSWPKWHLSMLEASQTSPGKIGIGATCGGANKVLGLRMPWTSKITEYEQDKKWQETIVSGSTVIEESVTFDPIEGGTKLTEVYDMKVGGFLRFMAPMVISSMRKEMKANLTKLKENLEAQVQN